MMGAQRAEAGPRVITSQAGQQPADFTDVRATNLAVVLRYIRANAPCSRATIAASTGLNKATVSSLVAELIDRRLLRETGLTENRIGRPATMLVLDGAAYAAIGLEVNTDHLTVVAIDLAGERLLSWRRAFGGRHAPPARAVTAAAALARRAVSKVLAEGREVLGLTVGVAGLVGDGGVVRLAPNLGWRDVALRDALVQALDGPEYPVEVENEANLAVRAEHRYGPYAGVANLVYLNGQAGVGAGIIADGRLLRGGLGFSGEIGHVRVDPDGPVCGCGRRGCLEAVAGIKALVARVGNNPDPADLEPEVDDIVRRARNHEPAVVTALREAGEHLGHAVSLLSNVVNPEVVLLGGYFVPLAPWLMPAAEQQLRAGTVAPDAGGCRLTASALGQVAAAIGGAASILDAVDAGTLPVPQKTRPPARASMTTS
jgi:predicted NBD/HSP70 family sugar kinase